MLDIDTLRVAQAAVAACTFALVFFGTYRPSRTPYAGWWSAVVLMSSSASVVYLLGPVTHPEVAEALGDGITAVAAALVWAAARSLRLAKTLVRQVITPGVVVMAVSLVDLWREGTPVGTPAMLTVMALYLGMSARELWSLAGERFLTLSHERYSGTRTAVVAMAVVSSIGCLFYSTRIITYLTAGPSSDFYVTWTGPVSTTFLVMVLLLVVTHTVSELSQFEVTREWRERATRDDLTGLLNRTAFMERADKALRRARSKRTSFALVIADFDHFKAINDSHGHAEGDRTLVSFGRACREVLNDEDLACRLGGEEFVLLLVDADAARAKATTSALSEYFGDVDGGPLTHPTISYGIAVGHRDVVLRTLMERADRALYQAKEDGRNRAVVDGTEQPST